MSGNQRMLLLFLFHLLAKAVRNIVAQSGITQRRFVSRLFSRFSNHSRTMASKRTVVSTSSAPAPLPQFSQAVKYNGLIFCSGSIGMDPVTKKIVPGTTKDRARQALRNLQRVVEAAGSTMDDVVKATVFLSDMANFALLNEAWDEFFRREPKPVSLTEMCTPSSKRATSSS